MDSRTREGAWQESRGLGGGEEFLDCIRMLAKEQTEQEMMNTGAAKSSVTDQAKSHEGYTALNP